MNKQVLSRLKQPSSWAAIAAVLGIFLPGAEEQAQAAMQVAAVVAGAAGVLLNERGTKTAKFAESEADER